MTIQRLLTAVTILALFSCGTKQTSSDNKKVIKSFELSPTNGKDTINVVDSKGWKQGIWLKTLSTDNLVSVSDTMVYLNDTAYSTKNSTAREVIKMLNARSK